ncbi:MAG: S-adenosyl-l-methionine hydroxide adenosyltransferase family protein [Euryarchaeota archaeon]|nr:S-adenosyl-l-methionine hydroxide adenosyltransferase family protein [Euryarchaeota archaeon]
MKLITLLTDFGTKDAYVAEMKGVILSINPSVQIIDITHDIQKFNILQGAHALASAAQYFPKDTIHVAVVDPGVGTKRRPIIVQTKHCYLIGPDNGLLYYVAEKFGVIKSVEITNKKYMLNAVSSTFHGRDIFSPAAAWLAKGISLKEFGPEISDIVKLEIPMPQITNNKIIGEVLHTDEFGNITTNIPSEVLNKLEIKFGDKINLKFGKNTLSIPFLRTYGEIAVGKMLALIGSENLLEIAINQGNAAQFLSMQIGTRIEIIKGV